MKIYINQSNKEEINIHINTFNNFKWKLKTKNGKNKLYRKRVKS